MTEAERISKLADELKVWAREMQSRRTRIHCRVAYIVDGREGWAPWRPISHESALRETVAQLNAASPSYRLRAWVERR